MGGVRQRSAEHPEGARRAANGHREPYRATIWELGTNSGGRPDGVADAHQQCRPLSGVLSGGPQAGSPGTKLVACGPGADFTPAWNAALIRQAGKDLSYLSVHYVVNFNPLLAKPVDADAKTAIALALPVGMANLLKSMRAQFDGDSATKGRVGLAYTEWNLEATRARGSHSRPTSAELLSARVG